MVGGVSRNFMEKPLRIQVVKVCTTMKMDYNNGLSFYYNLW